MFNRRGLGRDYLEAHAVQVLDKPRKTFSLKARNNTLILFTAKEAAEALVELQRSSVEIGVVLGHCVGSRLMPSQANVEGLGESAGRAMYRCLA